MPGTPWPAGLPKLTGGKVEKVMSLMRLLSVTSGSQMTSKRRASTGPLGRDGQRRAVVGDDDVDLAVGVVGLVADGRRELQRHDKLGGVGDAVAVGVGSH